MPLLNPPDEILPDDQAANAEGLGMQQRQGRPGSKALAAIEATMKDEARRVVAARADQPPPVLALQSMLGLLGCGDGAHGCNLADPAVGGPVAARLRHALRRERAKARGANAGYDLGRHLALHEMLRHLAKICPAIPAFPPKQSSPAR